MLKEETRIEWCGASIVLTWVSIYWFSRAGPAAAARIYYETRQSGERNNPPMGIVVPTGVAYFPKELRVPPRRYDRFTPTYIHAPRSELSSE